MATARFETEKFNGKNDFGLWRIKMRAILTQQGLADALKSDKSAKEGDDDQKRVEMLEKAHSAIILCLGDKVLREVAREKTAAAVWAKLESLYMTKSLANRLFMKQKLYSYRISEEKSLDEQLEEFNKSIDDLENIDVKLEDEDKAIMLLNALPRSFEHLKDAMLFRREASISMEEVQCALRAKELQKSCESRSDSVGEGLNVKSTKGFKPKKGGFGAKKSGQEKGNENGQKETRKCHYCKKPGHIRKNCFDWKKKQSEKDLKPHNTADCAEECDEGEMLNVVESHIEGAWIMDSCWTKKCSPKVPRKLTRSF